MSSEKSVEEARNADRVAAARAELERKSTEELFAATLEREYDDDVAWEAIAVLRLRGSLEVFEVARRYCESGNPKATARGLSVLAQLGAGKPLADRPFLDDSVSIAIDHLRDLDSEAVRSAAWALSHLGTERAVAALIDLRSCSDPEVRQAVACCIELRSRPESIGILIALMEDNDKVVRDWATFALGWRMLTQRIRQALRNRLDDSYEEARREAIWGLAKRKDPLGLKLLLTLLNPQTPGSEILMPQRRF